jgi:hypothetical protein
MNRLYQWLFERASFFRSDRSDQGMSRTIRTETTVERESTTLLVDGSAASGFDICPLCGNKLTPDQAKPPSESSFSRVRFRRNVLGPENRVGL